MDNKEQLLEKLLKCNRCGLCQEVCPTYKISSHEFAVARGRLRLIRMALEGELSLEQDGEIENFIQECLLCGACEEVCPSFVPITDIIREVKEDYVQRKGLSLVQKIIYRGVFARNNNLQKIRKLALVYQGTGAQRIIQTVKVLKASPLNLLPPLAQQSTRQQLPKVLNQLPPGTRQVTYFLGCSVNNFFSELGIATIKVLQENNCQVIVPRVNCCGAPQQNAGDREATIRLAKLNLDVLGKIATEFIVVDCATCGAVLQSYAKLLRDDPKYQDLAQEIAHKVIDICAYLIQIGFRLPRVHGPRLRVTYHDPCHGLRSLKVKEEPRQILAAIDGVELVEMREADSCCGGAGVYSVFQAKTSKDILKAKIDNFQKANADLLATSCPACMMQLGYGLELAGLSSQVMHPVQILARAYEQEKE